MSPDNIWRGNCDLPYCGIKDVEEERLVELSMGGVALRVHSFRGIVHSEDVGRSV